VTLPVVVPVGKEAAPGLTLVVAVEVPAAVLGAVVEMIVLLTAILAVAMEGEHPVKLNDLVLVEEMVAAVLDLTLVAVAEVPAVIVEMTA